MIGTAATALYVAFAICAGAAVGMVLHELGVPSVVSSLATLLATVGLMYLHVAG